MSWDLLEVTTSECYMGAGIAACPRRVAGGVISSHHNLGDAESALHQA